MTRLLMEEILDPHWTEEAVDERRRFDAIPYIYVHRLAVSLNLAGVAIPTAVQSHETAPSPEAMFALSLASPGSILLGGSASYPELTDVKFDTIWVRGARAEEAWERVIETMPGLKGRPAPERCELVEDQRRDWWARLQWE